MTGYDCWKIFPRMPQKVTIGDISVRDRFQHDGKFMSTETQRTYLEGVNCREDTLVQIDEMGIEHGWDVDRVLWLEHRPGLDKLKIKMGETPGQEFPRE